MKKVDIPRLYSSQKKNTIENITKRTNKTKRTIIFSKT